MSFEEELNKLFDEQTKAMEEMEVNGPEIFEHALNDQQKLTVQMLKERDFFLNYSDTGAGKTKAAISCAYYLNARHTLIFCPTSVKNTWKRQIVEANFVDENMVPILKKLQEVENENRKFPIDIDHLSASNNLMYRECFSNCFIYGISQSSIDMNSNDFSYIYLNIRYGDMTYEAGKKQE